MGQSSNAKATIALDHLDRQTFGDHELRQEILALFLTQMDRLFGMMQDASPAEARDIVHTLKGSARAVGAFQIADAAEYLEDSLGTPEGSSEPMLRLAEAVSRARPDILALLGRSL